ncbi:unnamed protein product, partial [Tetraodon nigroviridis]
METRARLASDTFISWSLKALLLHGSGLEMETQGKIQQQELGSANPTVVSGAARRWSVPMMMSITHRGTGVGLSGAISAFAVAALLLPGSYPDYLDMISSLSIGPVLIGMAKLGIAFPVSYHTYNGIRHL